MSANDYGKGEARPDVSIRIINWNTHELLELCIESIIKNTQEISYELVIIDNDSPLIGFDKVKERFSDYKNIIWLKNDKNQGGFVDHLTLPYCRGRYLLILGPDTIVLPQAIKELVEFMDNNKEAGAVTAKLLNTDGSPQNCYYKFWNVSMFFFSSAVGRSLDKIFFNDRFKRYYFGWNINSNQITIVDQPSGACLMLRWDPPVVNYITNEDFPFYFGDVDLCKRIYMNGYKIFLLPSAEVIHFHGSSFKKADNTWKKKEFRSSIIKYFKKYHKNKVALLESIILIDSISKYVCKIFEFFFPTWMAHLKNEIGSAYQK